MRIIHTSDWHIGRTLYGRKRYREFEHFFEWLTDRISTRKVDALLVSGDVFDTTTPSNRSQEIYYRFLFSVAASCCRHVVITGGNHDSPSFLNAPKSLLRTINIHVVGAAASSPEDEVISLKDENGRTEAIVCAVPYLRDRDIRSVKAGESLDDKAAGLIQGIKDHYSRVRDYVEKMVQDGPCVPVIGMGHLFAAGGKTSQGDGVRTLHVGSLSQVGADVFGNGFDYVALGHLHIPQTVNKKENIRYCGSPIPMSFGEADQKKQVVQVTFDGKTPEIEQIAVPCFQDLKRVSGDMPELLDTINLLKQKKSRAWLEIEYTGDSMVPDLKQQVETAVEETFLQVGRIRNKSLVRRMAQHDKKAQTLEELSVHDVFSRLLDVNEIAEEERDVLTATYNQAVNAVQEDDPLAR